VAQADSQTHANTSDASALSRKRLFYFGLADMPIQMAAVPVAAFVPNYYSQDLGVSLTAVGLILLLSRSFDAITDPLIGWLSDRTNTRWGRRRVWMLASVPLFMVSIYKLFLPDPGAASATYLLIWLVVLWLAWTMLFIPYYAWAAELSPDYNERTRITGWRSSIGLGANVLSKLVPVVAVFCCAYGGTQETLFLVGTMTLILLPITVGLTVAMVPEGKDFIPARMPLLPGLRLMWRNAPFKRLIAAFFVNQLGTSISTALIVFYVRSVLQDDEKTILQLLVYYTFNLCGIPFFVKFSSRVGKHRAWCYALFLFSFFMLGYLLLGPGDFYWMLPIASVTGFLAGCFWVVPNSMKADVIDIDRLESGEDRTAWYFAVWSLATKIALSVGPFIALTLLSFTGYEPASQAGTYEGSTLGLKLLFVFGPATGFLITALIAWNYPLTEEKHRVLRADLEASRARTS
jgi:GPH family glycoside/pentoside/hexuronide:cation symporter